MSVVELSVLAEKAVLGAVLIQNHTMAEVRGLLRADDFQDPANRAVFLAMCALGDRGTPIDPLTLSDQLRLEGESLQLKGGPEAYAIDLASSATLTSNVKHHAEIVARHYALRRLAIVAADVAKEADGSPEEAQRLVLECQRLVTQAARGRSRPGYDLAELVQPVMNEIEARQRARKDGGGKLVGISTTIPSLDYLTGGYRPGSLVVVGARTSMGKTAYACQVALMNAMLSKIPALVFSLEMTPRELVERFFARMARIDSGHLRTGELDVTDWKSLYAAGASMMETPGLVTISTARSLPEITMQARAFRVKHPEGLAQVVVDYLQLVRTGERGRSREQEIAEITLTLKDMAGDLDVPVIAPAQLNRGPETENRDPKVSDLRESGSIENDADLIAMIVRKRGDVTGNCWVNVLKHRNGPTGEVECTWQGNIYQLRDADGRPADGPHPDEGDEA